MESLLYQVESKPLVHFVEQTVAARLDEVDGVVAEGAGEGGGDDARREALAETLHFVGCLGGQDLQEIDAFADALQLIEKSVHFGLYGLATRLFDHSLADAVVAGAQLRDLVAERGVAGGGEAGRTDQLVRDAAQGGYDDDGGFLAGTDDFSNSEDALRCAHRRTAEFQDLHN